LGRASNLNGNENATATSPLVLIEGVEERKWRGRTVGSFEKESSRKVKEDRKGGN